MADAHKLNETLHDILAKQNNLTEAVEGLIEDVNDLHIKNLELLEENAKLKEKLYRIRTGKESIDVVEEPVVLDEPIIQKYEEPSLDISKDEPVIEAMDYNPPIATQTSIERIDIQKKSFNFRDTAIAEFFLGKNVIAKIASILIFLGIVSFGQLAYMEWLDDIGRVLLIVFAGVVFGVIGYFSEKKEFITFSNVFYGIGATILLYSNILASYNFKLYSETWYSYISIALMIGLFIYFWNRRYDFLDSVLYILYLFIVTVGITYNGDIGSVSSYIEQTLMIGSFGYISYMYLSKYTHNRLAMRNIITLLFSCFMLFIFLYMNNSYSFYFGKTPYQITTMIVYAMMVLGFFYYLHLIQQDQPLVRGQFILPVTTIVLFLAASGIMTSVINEVADVFGSRMGWLLLGITLAPLYGLLYFRKENIFVPFKRLYIYTIGLTIVIYSIVGYSLQGYHVMKSGWLNLINALAVVIFYLLYRWTKDESQRNVTIGLVIILIFRQIGFHIIDDSFLFKDSMVAFVGFGSGLFLFGEYHLFRHLKHEEPQLDNVIIHSIIAIMIIPLVVTLTNELLSSDFAYIFGIMMACMIAYRWLLEVPYFNLELKKHLVLGLNIILMILVLFLNAQYFNHDFTKFDHILKFTILLFYNIYIVYSLREIYRSYVPSFNEENFFIAFYLIGVLLHSLFLHNYINFSFDRVVLSSYFLISSAIAVLAGFRYQWSLTRKIGLGAIYFSLAKIFIYDLMNTNMTTFVRMMTFFILGFILLAISILYAYLERTYGNAEVKREEPTPKNKAKYRTKL